MGTHVTEHIADGKEQDTRAEWPRSDARQRDLRDLARAEYVGQQEDRDERRHDEIVIAKGASAHRVSVDRPVSRVAHGR